MTYTVRGRIFAGDDDLFGEVELRVEVTEAGGFREWTASFEHDDPAAIEAAYERRGVKEIRVPGSSLPAKGFIERSAQPGGVVTFHGDGPPPSPAPK
jgi:hypothetical protein